MIGLEDAEWARIVVDRCVTTMITEAERHIAENKTQAYHQKVLRLIQGAGARGLTKSEITRRTQFLDIRQRQEILVALIEFGSGRAQPARHRHSSGHRLSGGHRVREDPSNVKDPSIEGSGCVKPLTYKSSPLVREIFQFFMLQTHIGTARMEMVARGGLL